MADQSTRENLDSHYLRVKKPEMHWLRKPHGFTSGMAQGNLGYQMQYSVEVLEGQLAEEGNPHILQINAYGPHNDWKNPTSWHLYVDGLQVASGDGEFAAQCFPLKRDEIGGRVLAQATSWPGFTTHTTS